MKEKIIIGLSSLFSLGLIIGALSYGGDSGTSGSSDNIRDENGVQIVRVFARGGYSPRRTLAKAGVPTKIEIETKGTYDCSSALVIPSIGYREFLEPTGVTTIDIKTQTAGSVVRGLCAMGMYSFEVGFE